MYFHIIISRIPAVQFFFCGRRPQNCTIKNTAVPEAVWKPTDINASSFSKGFYCHLYFLVFLDQNLCLRKCEDVLFTFTKINLSMAVSKDKVISVLFPVVFVCIKIKASLFFYPQHIIQLKIFSLPLMGCRFSYSDESAAIVDKFLYRSDYRLVNPVFSATLGSVTITYVDHYIKFLQKRRVLPDIVKTDKFHIKRCST